MENIDFATLFQGIGTMMASGWFLASARIFLVLLGLLLIYLGWKGVLDGYDPNGVGNGSYQLRDTDYARRHIRQPLSRSDAFGHGCTNEYDADRLSTTCIHSYIQ